MLTTCPVGAAVTLTAEGAHRDLGEPVTSADVNACSELCAGDAECAPSPAPEHPAATIPSATHPIASGLIRITSTPTTENPNPLGAIVLLCRKKCR